MPTSTTAERKTTKRFHLYADGCFELAQNFLGKTTSYMFDSSTISLKEYATIFKEAQLPEIFGSRTLVCSKTHPPPLPALQVLRVLLS